MPLLSSQPRPVRPASRHAELASHLAPSAVRRARRVKLLIFDVDGVLTDGSLWFFPLGPQAADPGARPAETMVEVKAFSAHDGIGFAMARTAGLATGLITKRMSQSLARRAGDLHLDFVRQGVEQKGEAVAEILRAKNLAAEEVGAMGDDIIDLPMLRACGFAAAPANARREVRAAAHFVARHSGGAGAARDCIEFVLRAQNRWQAATAEYLRLPGRG